MQPHRRQIALLVVALAVALLALAAVDSSDPLPGPAFASHGSTPGQVDSLSIDADPSSTPANTAVSLGSRQDCIPVTTGSTFDIDVTVDEVDPADGIAAFQVFLLYDPTILEVVGYDTAQMIAAIPGSTHLDASDPLPDDGDGVFIFAAADTASPPIAETGAGVLVRVTLEALASGASTIAFDVNQTGVIDPDSITLPIVAFDAALTGVDHPDPCSDPDLDGVKNVVDNCPGTANPGQENAVHPGTPIGDHCEDPEPDGVLDISDTCQDDADNDSDSDGICVGAGFQPPKTSGNDNCPSDPNAGQDNADGDPFGDACDNCPATATAWLTPIGDDDCDGWTTATESAIGTDPTDPCANTPTANDEPDDRWPPDFDDNQLINIIDVLALKPVFGTPSARHDLDASGGNINIIDVLRLKPVFGATCT